jgi:phosphate transport system substrate-binding protein
MKNDLNDDFLLCLRAEPSKNFLSTLKASLDRQAIKQEKVRRTLFRTAILAALIGGSAVAVAFALLGGSPAGSRLVHIERSGGGAPRTITSPAQVGLPPAPVIAAAPTAEQSHALFVIAGPTAIILNAQDIMRRWLPRDSNKLPAFNLTSSTEALAMLCHQGAGAGSADIAGASRRILASELEHCKFNGVTHIAEIQSGYESVVLARSKLYGSAKLSARDIFLALASEVPDPYRPQTLIKNPYRTWSAVDSALLEERIEVFGPSLSSATAAAFRQTLMEAGCSTFPWLAALKQADSKRYEKVCRTLRDDGVYRNRGEKLQEQLETYPNALALLDFREVAAQPETFAAASVDGIEPRIDTITAETYPGSRAMFLYVNTARVSGNPGMLSIVDGYRRSVEESWSITTLVAPQRQADARKYLAPLQDMKF